MASTQKKQSARPSRAAARRQAARNKQAHNALLAGLIVLLVLVFFLGNLISRDRSFSETENRNLAQKPKLSWAAVTDGSFFSGISDWYSDQFFARDRWRSISLWETTRLRQRESGGVILGDQGYLFGKPDAPAEEAVAANCQAVSDFALAYPEIRTGILLAPSSAAILPELLPEGVPIRDQIGDIRMVHGRLDPAVRWLDAVAPLKAHRDEYLYYRTDHHWTSLGAFYTYAANAMDMGLTLNQNFRIYDVADDFEGTLSAKSGSHSALDSIQIYAPGDEELAYYVLYDEDPEKKSSIYVSDALETRDKYTVFFGGNHSIIDINTTVTNGRTLLVFKDSYANCFIQFLMESYQRIIIIDPRYYYGSLPAVLSSGVTDVLYLFSSDTFLTDNTLSVVLGSSIPEDFGTVPEAEPAPAASPSPAPSMVSPEDSSLEPEEPLDPEAGTPNDGSQDPGEIPEAPESSPAGEA